MRVLVTGSADGIGHVTATELKRAGHEVVVHVRNEARRHAVSALVSAGAQVVVGDLAEPEQVISLAEQANGIGRMDAVIHNAGVGDGASVLPVNVVAPYVLTVSMLRPARLVYLSSGMHRGGRPRLDGLDWSGRRATSSYSDSKLFVTALSAAVGRLWPDVLANAVDPGWVPTRMGGRHAPDDLRLGSLTQEWLATSDEPEALTSGGYWHHQRRVEPNPSVHDEAFQNRLLAVLADATGLPLT